MLSFLKHVLKLIFLAAAVTVSIQNPLIFPGASDALIHSNATKPLPPSTERFSITTADGERLDGWRLAAPVAERKVALILHGNMGDLHKFFYIQQFFRSVGYTSYDIDYRGYGQSSGWPSERGIYLDAEALLHYVKEREHIAPEKIVLVGVSLGSGPATYLAEKFQVSTLLLVAPYTSIPDVVRDRRLLHLLAPFVWISFPNAERMAKLNNTCVISLHGKHDQKILPAHTERLRAAYRGRKTFVSLLDESADHNNIFTRAWPRVVPALKECVEHK